jgi:hypothetical protein
VGHKEAGKDILSQYPASRAPQLLPHPAGADGKINFSKHGTRAVGSLSTGAVGLSLWSELAGPSGPRVGGQRPDGVGVGKWGWRAAACCSGCGCRGGDCPAAPCACNTPSSQRRRRPGPLPSTSNGDGRQAGCTESSDEVGVSGRARGGSLLGELGGGPCCVGQDPERGLHPQRLAAVQRGLVATPGGRGRRGGGGHKSGAEGVQLHVQPQPRHHRRLPAAAGPRRVSGGGTPRRPPDEQRRRAGKAACERGWLHAGRWGAHLARRLPRSVFILAR